MLVKFLVRFGSESCCASGCTNTVTDPNNCGGCGVVCPTGLCANSMWWSPTMNTCAGPGLRHRRLISCANGCSNVTTDPNKLRRVRSRVPPGRELRGGTCQSGCGSDGGACAVGQTCCLGGCANTQTDPQNCGGCNIECGATACQCRRLAPASRTKGRASRPDQNPTYLWPGVHSYMTIMPAVHN